jgi:hypothetical protein
VKTLALAALARVDGQHCHPNNNRRKCDYAQDAKGARKQLDFADNAPTICAPTALKVYYELLGKY